MAARNEPPVALRRLLPQPGELTADELVSGYAPWQHAQAKRPFIAVNMVQTADGRAAVHGRTASISSVADRQLFHALRTRVDAVMVGAGTVRIERYGRLVRDPLRREQRVAAGLAADPLAIVVSGSLDLPADVPLLQDPDSRVVIITSSPASLQGVRAHVEYVRHASVDLPSALAQLRAEHGVRAILCEGGPHLNASLVVRRADRRAVPDDRPGARRRDRPVVDHGRRAARGARHAGDALAARTRRRAVRALCGGRRRGTAERAERSPRRRDCRRGGMRRGASGNHQPGDDRQSAPRVRRGPRPAAGRARAAGDVRAPPARRESGGSNARRWSSSRPRSSPVSTSSSASSRWVPRRPR